VNDGDLSARLGRLSVAGLADMYDRRGVIAPVLARELKFIGAPRRFAGPAFCVMGRKLEGATWLPVSRERDALYDGLADRMPVGAVVVMDCGSYDDTAVFGGGTGFALKLRGCAGAIVDGAVRDTEEIAQNGLPVLARAVSAIRFVGRFRITALDCPIEVRGLAGPVTVMPGDLMLADHDGAIALSRQIAAEIIADAEEAERIEGLIKAEVLSGVSRLDAVRKHRKT
jgi:regulator of RNase E activity RraA